MAAVLMRAGLIALVHAVGLILAVIPLTVLAARLLTLLTDATLPDVALIPFPLLAARARGHPATLVTTILVDSLITRGGSSLPLVLPPAVILATAILGRRLAARASLELASLGAVLTLVVVLP